MKRRDFLATGSLAVLAATPAVSSAPPTAKGEQIHWKMVTAWPKNFPGVGVSARVQAAFEKFRKQVVGWTEVSEYAYLRARSAGSGTGPG